MIRLLLASLLFLSPLALSSEKGPPHAVATLATETVAVQAGQPLHAGVLFRIDKGWHIYWKNPGDSGEPVRMHFHLPSGFTAGEIEWPRPEREEVGPLVNFGYRDTVLLPVTIRTPETISSDTVDLATDVSWLVCSDVCIPGKAHLTQTLPVSAGTPDTTEAAPLFEETRQAIPKMAPAEWKAAARLAKETIRVEIADPKHILGENVFFFPDRANVIDQAAPQTLKREGNTATLVLKRSDQLSAAPEALSGVLTSGNQAFDVAFSFNAKPAGASLFEILALAFLGGIILNAMPCVFPILSIKALHIFRQAGAHPRETRVEGLLYTTGIVVSFWALAGALILLRAGGEKLGWGFQLQSPVFVFALAALLFLMSMSLLGVFEMGSSLMSVGSEWTGGNAYASAFFTGVLATVVATPCSAPFMGTAVGFAATQPPVVALLVFTFLALGLAAPYVVVCFSPVLGTFLPKPGRWMETLKEVMAFPLLATVIWLLWVLDLQAGPNALALALIAILVLGLGAWMLGRWRNGGVFKWTAALLLVAGLVVGGYGVRGGQPRVSTGAVAADGEWQPWSRPKLQSLLSEGKPVFVDFSAAWCVTCKVNETVAFVPSVMQEMKKRGVVPLRADWTDGNPEITNALREFERDGVPLYVLYPRGKGATPRVLPQVLTPGLMLDELSKLK